MRYKPYGDLQSLPVLIYWWKNLSINFVTSLSILNNWKSKNYNSIIIIVDCLTKLVFYELVKVTIDRPGLMNVIIDIIVCHYKIPKSIVTD